VANKGGRVDAAVIQDFQCGSGIVGKRIGATHVAALTVPGSIDEDNAMRFGKSTRLFGPHAVVKEDAVSKHEGRPRAPLPYGQRPD
jgi:hypothetical protein